jgi:hypothetical protein
MDKAARSRHRSAMAEIVNLRSARKAKARVEASAKAAENRTRFGRTKAQKTSEAAEAERAARLLDQVRREGD